MNQELPKSLREALARQTGGDVHPSADALTAFVEHGLPNRESQRVTDHLATCKDCREVVFLASSAAEEPVGEEQEWMPATAVPRISPALLAKPDGAKATASTVQVDALIRRRWMLRWAWIPAVAVIALVSAVLIRRTEFVRSSPPSALTMASKSPVHVATNEQHTPPASPQPESEAKLAQKPLTKSARVYGNSTRASDTLPSALVASKAAEQYQSAPAIATAPKATSPPAPAAIGGVYQPAPAAAPRQNAFVESESQNALGLVARPHAALEKPQVGLLPAIATRRQWRVTPDGHIEHSTSQGTWSTVLADQPATFHVVSVVGDNVWAGGSGGVLFHSNDGGQNWSEAKLSAASGVETGIIVSVQFSDQLHGVITTDHGARWTTSNGGVIWTKE